MLALNKANIESCFFFPFLLFTGALYVRVLFVCTQSLSRRLNTGFFRVSIAGVPMEQIDIARNGKAIDVVQLLSKKFVNFFCCFYFN